MIVFLIINAIIFLILTGYHFYNFLFEKKYIKKILSGIEDIILKNQLSNDLYWYIQRIYYYKYIYYTLTLIIIEINAIIPVLNNSLAEEKRITISLISVIATIFTGVISFTKCNESWLNHRKTYESLKYEVECYINKLKEYKNEDKAKELFYEKYYDLKYNNFNKWLVLRDNKNKDNLNSKEAKK